jgi:hypothetical protein
LRIVVRSADPTKCGVVHAQLSRFPETPSGGDCNFADAWREARQFLSFGREADKNVA